jgi:glycogen operon protein
MAFRRSLVSLLAIITLFTTLGFDREFISCRPKDGPIIDQTPDITDLGAIPSTGGVNFAVYSEHASRIDLLVFNQARGVDPVKVVSLTKVEAGDISGKANVWRVFVSGLKAGTYYGYRAWGPNWEFAESWKCGSESGFQADVDAFGNRFNPNKLLIDPYAKAISHDPIDATAFASGPKYRAICNYQDAPKSIVVDDNAFDWGNDRAPNYPQAQTVIYEVHVRGFTQNSNANVNEAARGTYKGLLEKIDYLRDLGITTIELMPIQETPNDMNSRDGGNYWGYNTLSYFAPDRRYAADTSPLGPVNEFKEMVKTLHANGLEVILDVVYNHTAEGGIWNNDPSTVSLYSLKGLDNSVYYQFSSPPPYLGADKQYYCDNTGTGANVHTVNPITQNLILDSLEYWANEMHVDGFRFDLAPVLGNVRSHGEWCFNFSKYAELLQWIPAKLPGKKIIAEPWAVGFDGYQTGQFPAGWSEWNDKFRTTARRYILSDANVMGELATRIAGSSDVFGGRSPFDSINYFASHDGFTLYDLVSYNRPNNQQAWPCGPSDGGDDNNYSQDWNSESVKRQQMRNFASLLLLSQGTPMLLGGDEFARTQAGNNNAYNIDSECMWLDWSRLTSYAGLQHYFQGLIAFRLAHPIFQRQEFLSGSDHRDDDDELPDIEWHGTSYRQPEFNNREAHTLAFRLDGSREETGAIRDDNDVYVALNNGNTKPLFQLPPNHPGKKWYRVVDTAAWAENSSTIKNNIAEPGQEDIQSDGSWSDISAKNFAGNESYGYQVNPYSSVVFIEK